MDAGIFYAGYWSLFLIKLYCQKEEDEAKLNPNFWVKGNPLRVVLIFFLEEIGYKCSKRRWNIITWPKRHFYFELIKMNIPRKRGNVEESIARYSLHYIFHAAPNISLCCKLKKTKHDLINAMGHFWWQSTSFFLLLWQVWSHYSSYCEDEVYLCSYLQGGA